MHNKTDHPDVSEQLLKQLKEYFPLKPPNLNTQDREIWWDAGRQEVIQYLEAIHDHNNSKTKD